MPVPVAEPTSVRPDSEAVTPGSIWMTPLVPPKMYRPPAGPVIEVASAVSLSSSAPWVKVMNGPAGKAVGSNEIAVPGN